MHRHAAFVSVGGLLESMEGAAISNEYSALDVTVTLSGVCLLLRWIAFGHSDFLAALSVGVVLP